MLGWTHAWDRSKGSVRSRRTPSRESVHAIRRGTIDRCSREMLARLCDAAITSGEPSVVVTPAARLVGVVVLAVVGAVGSVCVAVVARALGRRVGAGR